MKDVYKKLVSHILKVSVIIDILLSPLTLLSSLVLTFVRRMGLQRMHLSRKILLATGVLPVIDHYYEPFFDPSTFRKPLNDDRFLPGIEMNVDEQLELLSKFDFNQELMTFPWSKTGNLEFCYDNQFFRAGDAEYLYNMVRWYAPRTIIEIGSGNSTLMVMNALRKNREVNPSYSCEHICIEPYEMRWLEQTGVTVLRERVEMVDPGYFCRLMPGDILFIDSSHVIKPQGDLLAIYLEILPLLRSGVIVHIHDILTPRDYFKEWLVDEMKLWNEQYLLEALLSHTKDFKIIGALNYLRHHHYEALAAKCPVMASEQHAEPGSFWIMKN